VQFEKEQDAKKAIEGTNGSELDGKKLEVFAHEKRSTK
jgi:RNA recognition motif-containing protein